MNEHTLGPWHLGISGLTIMAGHYEDSCCIASIYEWDKEKKGESENKANARLISAAPALLEAGEAAREWFANFILCSTHDFDDERDVQARLESAIAKVKRD